MLVRKKPWLGGRHPISELKAEELRRRSVL
jgi:hypothetical protein